MIINHLRGNIIMQIMSDLAPRKQFERLKQRYINIHDSMVSDAQNNNAKYQNYPLWPEAIKNSFLTAAKHKRETWQDIKKLQQKLESKQNSTSEEENLLQDILKFQTTCDNMFKTVIKKQMSLQRARQSNAFYQPSAPPQSPSENTNTSDITSHTHSLTK